MSEQINKYPSPSIARAAQVIKELALAPNTLSELTEKLKIPKSTLHGIITTLNMLGWADYDEANRIILGEKIFEIGILYSKSQRILAVFQDVAQRLAAKTGETIFLGVLEGTNVLHLSRVDGTAMLRFVAGVGESFPAHLSALGKVLLAGKDTEEVKGLYSDFDFIPDKRQSLFSLSQLLETLSEVRQKDHALDLEEAHADIHCVAAPIYDKTEKIIASIALAAPVSRFEKQSAAYISGIVDSAREISFLVGYERKKYQLDKVSK